MRQRGTYGGKALQFFSVLLPILVTQVALVSTVFFDTVMAGNVSEYDLAGVAVAANLFFPVFGGMQGVIAGLTPIIAQLYGAGKKEAMPRVVVQGMYMAVLLGVCLIAVAAVVVKPLLAAMALEPRVAAITVGYLKAIACGFCPILAAAALRNFIDALGYTRVTMAITLCSVPFNIAMNYLFIFGKGGFPALGGVGAGVGSALTYWFVLLLNLLVVRRVQPFASYRVFARFFRPSLAAFKSHLAIGVPVGAAIFCEQSIFGAVGLLMAMYGTHIIAAHQAALNFSTLVYMVPLSISMALTILVGFEVGARRYVDAKRYSYMGILLSVLFSGALALALMQLRAEFAALYTQEPQVYQLIQTFLVYAIALQFSDAVSAPLQGALRGYKDVRVTLLLAILSYWAIGLPIGHAIARLTQLGPYGYWIGLIAGIAGGALFLGLRLAFVQRVKFPANNT